jgi:hypothetical protein
VAHGQLIELVLVLEVTQFFVGARIAAVEPGDLFKRRRALRVVLENREG